jgi:hypothetical protein
MFWKTFRSQADSVQIDLHTPIRGEPVFIDPSGEFSIYGITPGNSVNTGMTDVDLEMNAFFLIVFIG